MAFLKARRKTIEEIVGYRNNSRKKTAKERRLVSFKPAVECYASRNDLLTKRIIRINCKATCKTTSYKKENNLFKKSSFLLQFATLLALLSSLTTAAGIPLRRQQDMLSFIHTARRAFPCTHTKAYLASLSTKSSPSSPTDCINTSDHSAAAPDDNEDILRHQQQSSRLPQNSNQQNNNQNPQRHQQQHYKHIFTLTLPEGTCVGLRLFDNYNNDDDLTPEAITSHKKKHWVKSILHPDEISYGIAKKPRNTFFIGRIAMRHALHIIQNDNNRNQTQLIYNPKQEEQVLSNLPMVSKEEPSILKDKHGRPTMPTGYLGSISHKKITGVALVTPANGSSSSSFAPSDYIEEEGEDNFNTVITNRKEEENEVTRGIGIDAETHVARNRGIGIDIEQTCSKHRSIAKKVLTEQEISNLGNIDGVSKEEEVLLRFSLKESVYKAMHPLINQYVGFQEAEITPLPNGTANVFLNLTSKAHEQFDEESITAHWQRLCFGDGEEFFLTSASVSLKKTTDAEQSDEKENKDGSM